MITVLAEKFDVGVKIAAALSGFDFKGTTITMKNIEKYKPSLDKEVKPKGVIRIKYQGKDYAITWAQGHLLGLKHAKDYNPEYSNWRNIPFPYFPQYEIKVNEKYDWNEKKYTGESDPWTLRQLNIIGGLFDQSEYIINATDDDREGELIFAYIYQYLGCQKKYTKLKLDSQTEAGFKDAFANQIPSEKIKGIEMAGRCRAISDWSSGINISSLMTLKYLKYVPELKMITIGRVQSYVHNLIVEREKAIRAFVSHPFWNIAAIFTNDKGESYSAKHAEKQIEDNAKAQALFDKVNGKPGVVTKCETTGTNKEVPLLYSYQMLAIDTNNKLKLSANQTLAILQSLYEKGYITYPRTDSQHLTDDMQPVVDGVLDMLSSYSDEYKGWIEPVSKRNYTKRHFDTSKVESHFAIIPTNVTPVNMTDQEAAVYDLIAKSLIRIIYKAAKGEKTTIITEVEGEEFKSTGTVIIDPQWLVVDAMPPASETLPKLNTGEQVSGEYELKEGKTEPPKRYTEATLIMALKTASKTIDDEELKAMLETSNKGGIGRPSSISGIIEKVIRMYCVKKGQQIVPTEAGIKVIEMLPIEDFKSAELTALWETKLDRIQRGEESYDDLVAEMEANVAKWCKEINDDTREFEIPQQADTSTLDLACPKCGKPLRMLKWGWACTGYDKSKEDCCNFALGYNMSGATLTDKDFEQLLTKKKTKFINGFKKKDSDDTYGCFLTLDDDGNIGRTWETGLNCPKCGKPITVGTKGWSCSGWKEGCKFVIWNEFSHKKLTTAEKEQLILNGRTEKPVKNLVKNNGDKYDAVLILDADKKVAFAPKSKD